MKLLGSYILLLCAYGIVAPPVNEKKKDKEHEETNEVDPQALDVEYKRYLNEVVEVLENDEEFKNRLMKADPEDIKSGKIAKELEFVNHNVRTKLDELKRQEIDRLRKAAIQQYEYSNGIDKKHLKIPGHLDPKNPHTFEAEDLRKLIVHTAKELEDADRQRKEEFKEYELRKELEYQEQLKHMDDKNRDAAQKQHDEQQKKHKEHKPLHHPGSKQQFEEVWEEQDHLSPEDFNPKTFFHLHDLDGNGVWDANEVKALFKKELDKMYDPHAPEDDIRERYEEMERMREHVFNESDTNRDQLISYDEFLAQTKKQEFERDEGWKGLDENTPYSNDEYQAYAKQHEDEVRRMIDQGLIPPAPPGYVPMVIPPGHHPPQLQGQHQMHQPVYHVPPPQGGQGQPLQYQQHPQAGYQYNPNDPSHHQQVPYQQPHGQQQYQQAPVPQQQFHGQVPQQHHDVPAHHQQQQQYHAPPPHHDQQQYHAPPPQQHHDIPAQHQQQQQQQQYQQQHHEAPAQQQQQYQQQHHEVQQQHHEAQQQQVHQAPVQQHPDTHQQALPVQNHADPHSNANHAAPPANSNQVPVPHDQHQQAPAPHAADSSNSHAPAPQAPPSDSHSHGQPSH